MWRPRIWILSLALALGLAPMPSARADTLDQVLQILHTAGLVDGAVVDAKPLVQCLIEGGSASTCAGRVAAPAVGSALSAADPKVRLVVDLVLAAQQRRWIDVLELTGTDVLAQVACTAGFPAGGPVKDFICGGLFVEIAQQAKPVVRLVLVAVQSRSLDDWLKVAALLGPDLACRLLPDDVPGGDAICSTLAQVFGVAVQAVAAAVDAVWGTMQRFGEWISGQSKHMPVDTYYDLYWRPWYHYGVWTRFKGGWDGLMGRLWDPCVKYFDSHTMSAENARKTCDRLRSRFSSESAAMEQVLRAGGNAHVHTVAFELAEIFAVTDLGRESGVAAHRRLVELTCATELRKRLPLPGPDERLCPLVRQRWSQMPMVSEDMVEKIYQQCLADQDLQTPEPSAHEVICKSVGDSFENALHQHAMQVEKVRMQLLQGGHCVQPAGWDPGDGVQFVCSNFRAHQKCLAIAAAAHPKKRCTFDRSKSDTRLAGQIIDALGGRARCVRETPTRLACTRPWKQPECRALLAAARRQAEYADTPMQCVYTETAEFTAAKARAGEILAALNKPMAGGGRLRVQPPLAAALANCQTGFDPLAIHCADSGRYAELPQRLPGASLPICLPDPQRNGADQPCWDGPLTLPDRPTPIPRDRQSDAGDETPGRVDPNRIRPRLPAVLTGQPVRIQSEVRLASTEGRWETTVAIPAQGLARVRGGLCRVPVVVRLHNPAAAPSAPLRLGLRIAESQPAVDVAPLPASGTHELTLYVVVASGQRRLIATLSAADGSEIDSQTLSLRVEGSCG
ncbi:MAG: hypothetical protein IPK27_01305 [Rhodanobacteraceae bacterium]|nr:hypothetical protein [Rhodanobacteraceae bacterium]